jgi:hypothetical protein
MVVHNPPQKDKTTSRVLTMDFIHGVKLDDKYVLLSSPRTTVDGSRKGYGGEALIDLDIHLK